MNNRTEITLEPKDNVLGRRPHNRDSGNLEVFVTRNSHGDFDGVGIIVDSVNCGERQHFHEYFTKAQAREIGKALIDAAGPEPVEMPRLSMAHNDERAGRWYSIAEARAIASALNSATADQDRRAS
jgi:hypothetical protein